MENIHVLMAGLTAIILFIFGIDNFSKEIQRISGERFRKSLSGATKIPLVGVLIGAMVTAVIQSSSATSVITISLVNAGVLSFKSSVGIIFGSNIGTTITAQLVAFKLTAFAPIFIILGFILSFIKFRYSFFGKAIFYFGFVFFTLNLISSTLRPLQNNTEMIQWLTQPQNPLLAIAFGCLFTAVVQSSSVTTGLAIIFTQQGLLGLENAVPLIMGANIGTTATALIAVFNMDIAAKKTALTHFLFNLGGELLFLFPLFAFGPKLNRIEIDPAIALAGIHFIFNVATSVVFVFFIKPLTMLVDRLLGTGKMDFERLELPVFSEEDDFEKLKSKFDLSEINLLRFLQDNYSLVTLSIETNYQGIFDAAQKRIEYTDFVKKEYQHYYSQIVTKIVDEKESKDLIRIINRFDYLFQIHDSIVDLFGAKKIMTEHYLELKSDVLLLIRELSSQTLGFFDDIGQSLTGSTGLDISASAKKLQDEIDEVNQELLKLLSDPTRHDAGALTNIVTYSQRLKDKLVIFSGISQD